MLTIVGAQPKRPSRRLPTRSPWAHTLYKWGPMNLCTEGLNKPESDGKHPFGGSSITRQSHLHWPPSTCNRILGGMAEEEAPLSGVARNFNERDFTGECGLDGPQLAAHTANFFAPAPHVIGRAAAATIGGLVPIGSSSRRVYKH